MLFDIIGFNYNLSGLIRLNYIQFHLISLNAYEKFVNVEGID